VIHFGNTNKNTRKSGPSYSGEEWDSPTFRRPLNRLQAIPFESPAEAAQAAYFSPQMGLPRKQKWNYK